MSHTTKPSLAPSHASASAVMQGQKADGPLGLRFDSHAQPQLFDDAVLQDPAIQHQQLRHDAAPAQRPYQQLQPQQQHASLPSAYVPQVPLSEQHQQSRPTESMGGQFFPLIPVDSATVPVPYAQSIPFGDKIETSAVAAAAAADAIATGQQYMLSFSTNEQADHWTGLAQSAHIPNPAFLPAGARASHALGPSSHPIEMPMPMVPTPTQRHVVSYSALNQPPLMVGPSVATLDGVAFSNGHNMVHSVSTGDGTPAAATAAVSGNRPGHGKGKVLSSVTVCTFCRLRKLRCDGEQPCRQCERRSLQCVHAPASGAGRRELAIGRGAASAAAAKEGPYSKPKANKEKSKTSDGNNEAKGAIAARTVGSPDGGMDLAVPSEHFRPLDLAPGASLVDLVRVGPSGGQHAFDETPIHTQPPAAQATALHIHDGHHSSPAAGRITSIPPMLQPRKGRATTSFTVSMASPHQSLPNTQGQPTRAWTSADHVQPLALSQSQSRSKITASPPPEHTFTRSAEADDGLCQVAASATSGYLWLSYEVDPALYDDGDDASVASSQEEDEDKAEEEEDDHDVGAAIPEEPLPSALTGNRSASALHLVRNHSLRRRLHAARATIAREPDNRSSRNPGWWDEVVLIFGPSRARSRRMIKSLTEHFTTSNAIFFGLIYPPELMALLQDADKRAKAHPALLPAVLAVAMMSIKEKRPEPFNIDFLSIDPVTRQIVAKLHKMAITQLQATIESGSNRSITMAQATTLLTLLSEDVQEKRDLINLIQQTILGNRWAAAVPGSAASADAAFYTRPPSAVLEGGTADADVLLETLLRLCWTPSSHWMRDMLLAPHEDNIKLPLHLEMVRPIGHWEPSQLPKELPLSFHCIQELLRLGSHLVRIACKAARISSHQQALVLSERLDALEDRLIFIRLKGLDEGGHALRLLCAGAAALEYLEKDGHLD
ncbi:hypothetical protein K437DRAFT_261381 [Tilletiaria anomala UBC 951]|uniref:Zn(2)-C6 fungal-type domain-containing protein n=1 Tax=Tilletiaria anomala (strain ATCC 24038 / CBS 436.72 / UBC 951) TaxID=1037660 RepID=A0A066WN93_TILAU|nr:uncharacterized protein K437DRAFT_261381 [Tilletiaria anomala UBC 951]KDN52454.1 hypothetical protein K437DRAFT_261381 [Tilletiaria anomala UBC 951]